MNQRTPNHTLQGSCVIYCRIDLIDHEESIVLKEQVKACKDFCEQTGLIVQKVFKEQGKRAKEYGEIDKLMADIISRDDIKYIVVTSSDRIIKSTTPGRMLKYLNKIVDKEVEVIEVCRSSEISSIRQLRDPLLLSINSYEKQSRIENAVNGMRKRVAEGGWMGKVPLGYERVIKRQYEIVLSPQAEFILTAFEMKSKRKTTDEILYYLESHGISITEDSLRRIYNNIFYSGKVRTKFTNGKTVKGQHPAIVPDSLFETVQKMIRRRPVD